MTKRFLETRNFTRWVAANPPDWDIDFAALQQQLMENPELGKVVKGCGGVRKVRMGDRARGKGKRGGARVLYLHIPEVDWIYLLHIYGKNEKDDLSQDERDGFAAVAEAVKLAALRSVGPTRTED